MTPLDFPEARLLDRALKELGLDAVTALAVLLKTLGDDHLARLPHLDPVDDLAEDYDPDDEANARTPLERVLFVVKRECRKNGGLATRHDPELTQPADALPPAVRIAGELMVLQDDVREIIAGCLDHLRVYEAAREDRDDTADWA